MDNEVSNRYKTMAYNILSSLKDNKDGYKEVLQQLEAESLNDWRMVNHIIRNYQRFIFLWTYFVHS